MEYEADLAVQLVLKDCTVQKRSARLSQLSTESPHGNTDPLDYAIEAERMRIARELHDELDQALMGIKCDLTRLRHQLAQANGNAGDLAGDLDVIGAAIDAAMARTQRLVVQQRPPAS